MRFGILFFVAAFLSIFIYSCDNKRTEVILGSYILGIEDSVLTIRVDAFTAGEGNGKIDQISVHIDGGGKFDTLFYNLNTTSFSQKATFYPVIQEAGYTLTVDCYTTDGQYYMAEVKNFGEGNYPLGTLGPGGGYIIQELPGNHGVEVYISPYGYTDKNYGCTGYNIPGILDSVGSGPANTTKILNYCSSYNSGASYCSDFSMNGVQGWYLPSIDELFLIDSLLPAHEQLEDGHYLSSSQLDANNCKAMYRNSFGRSVVSWGKGGYARVLPVRNF